MIIHYCFERLKHSLARLVSIYDCSQAGYTLTALLLHRFILTFFHSSFNHVHASLVTAPSSAPANLLLVSVSSTSLRVSWDQILAQDSNGVIRRYSIHLTEMDTEKESSYSSLTRHHVITGLHPYYTYSCKVAAVTISSGPFSQPTEIQMPEDGAYIGEM